MLKKYLIPGLLVWAPLGITLWVVDFILGTLDGTLLLLPASWRPDQWLGFHIPGFGLLISLVVILATGVLARNYIGRHVLRWWEGLVGRIPIVRSIYASVKQVSETMLSPKGNAFRKVVLVEFPQPGQWTLGFVVGEPAGATAQVLGSGLVTVYVPTAPNPTSGYVLMMSPERVRDVDVSVDDALKFHVSLGVVAPTNAALPTAAPARPPVAALEPVARPPAV